MDLSKIKIDINLNMSEVLTLGRAIHNYKDRLEYMMSKDVEKKYFDYNSRQLNDLMSIRNKLESYNNE